MSLQTVEYIIRARIEEPAGVTIGDAMFDILGAIEETAVDQEIVSRTVLTDPDRPTRQICPTSATWHGRHYATDRRWTIATPAGSETVLCSAACALSWLVYALPADLRPTTENSGRNSESEAA